jgi:hypothetical protein
LSSGMNIRIPRRQKIAVNNVNSDILAEPKGSGVVITK